MRQDSESFDFYAEGVPDDKNSSGIMVKSVRRDSVHLQRMGTRRENIHNEADVEYRIVFVYLMIIINTIMFVVSMYLADWKFEKLDINPTIGPDVKVLVDLGAKDTRMILDGDWWRFFTPMFLHGGIIHLALNMFVLYSLGGSLEEAFGFFKVAAIYLISGFSGVMCSTLFVKDTISVGASGAIYGLIGALFGDFMQNHKIITEGKWKYLLNLVISTVIGLAFGLMPIVDNFAHIGGFIAGLLVGAIVLTNTIKDIYGKRMVPFYSKLLTVVAALLLVAWIAGSLSAIYQEKNGTDYCSFCAKINCVETDWWTCKKQCILSDGRGNERVVDCDSVE